jgi:hypothetical protein
MQGSDSVAPIEAVISKHPLTGPIIAVNDGKAAV